MFNESLVPYTQLPFPYLEKFSKVFTAEVVAEELVIIFTTIKLMTNLFKASQKPLES